MTLAEFITARLDEDEAAAKAAANADRHTAPEWAALTDAADTGFVIDAADPDYAITLDTLSEIVIHIARHDPARVLREVAAKRAILALHVKEPEGCPACAVCLSDREDWPEMWAADEWPCATLRHMAAVWSDHPGYQQEWKP